MKIITHTDLDGPCAGAIVAHYKKEYNPKNCFETDYITPLPIDSIEEDEEVYITDYSFKKNTVS